MSIEDAEKEIREARIASRRDVLMRTSALVAAGAALSSCALFSGSSAPVAVVVSAVEVLDTEIQNVLMALQSISPAPTWLTAALIAQVQQIVSEVNQVATAIGSVTTTASAQALVQQLETYISTLVNALAGLPLPPPISIYVQIAAVIMPLLFAIVGLVIPASMQMQAGDAGAKAKLEYRH